MQAALQIQPEVNPLTGRHCEKGAEENHRTDYSQFDPQISSHAATYPPEQKARKVVFT